jgi:SagB-type dehydrogenase family enzyme
MLFYQIMSASAVVAVLCAIPESMAMTRITLPNAASPDDGPTLAAALHKRRSMRAYSEAPLTLEQIAQLLWAAQGINDPSGLRTAPSAGALYPLELLLVAGNVDGLEAGVYRYRPGQHALELMLRGDQRRRLAKAALGQSWIARAAVVLVITAVYERTTRKYGDRGRRYVHIEVGHAAQNTLLQAAALHLGAGLVGAFDDTTVAEVLALPASEHVLYLLPIGGLDDSP